MSELKNEFREKFKKSDAISALKKLSETISKEEFLDFSNSALLDAYRSKRAKAVEFMLSFYDKEQPSLLLKIHLDVMLSEDKEFESEKKMLIPLVKHFPEELCISSLNNIIEHKKTQYPKRDLSFYKLKQDEILKIIAEKELPREIIVPQPTLLEVMRENPDNLKNDAREKFNTSNILDELKELSQNMSKEDFMDFTNSAMKSAYDKNKVKAVEYMLSFYEKDNPKMLMIGHLQIMLANQKDFELGKKMLIPLAKNFSYEFCDQVMNQYISIHAFKKDEVQIRKAEISKIILEQTLNQDNKTVSKKLKL